MSVPGAHPHGHGHGHDHGAHVEHVEQVRHDEPWGLPPWLPRNAPSPLAWLALLLIGVYRRVISPALPPACRFMPTCSEYGYEAIARYGILSGGRRAVWRILRCNPFGGSGYDPVP